jgi:fatty acid synthase subunit beta
MDHLAANPFNINLHSTPSPMGASPIGSPLEIIIRNCLAQTDAKSRPLTLQRGKATIPLKVNVPFHSSLLRPGVESFRYFLEQSIPEELVIPEKLIGKYIPNLTAKPFELTKEYLEDVYELTQSFKVKSLLADVRILSLSSLRFETHG